MLLRAEYITLAMQMQEMADGKVSVSERGARNSRSDMSKIQAVHDHACELGANCSMAEAAKPKESEVSRETPENLALVESAETLETIVLKEAKADYEIKLIAPGKGSSAFYPAEVLKRDGPNVFKAGTHVYLNHPTAAEESARPEGDVKNLAGVLTTSAVYHESHAKGPGLYGRMKVFADHAQTVEEKAAHVGMSIRAAGVAESGKRQEGLPVLKELTSAESVDVVTRAGAGGMILTEAAGNPANPAIEFVSNQAVNGNAGNAGNPANPANPAIQTQEAAMDAAELTKLQEAITAQAAANAKLLERALRGDAREEAQRIMAGITLPEASKARVIESVLRSVPTTEAGELDTVKFTEAVNAEAKREGVYVAGLTGSGRVTGMGSAPAADPDTEKRMKEASAVTHKRALDVFSEFGLPESAVKAIASGYGEAA